MKNKIYLIVLFILAIFPILSLFHSGFPITHDGQDHVARIANFYQNLTEGNLIPRWAANLNWGYGHPVLEFLYPLPSYFASILHAVGFSLVDSTKVVFGLGVVLSFVFMYLWLSQFSSKVASLFGSVLYVYAPYRFIDLYVRGDIGENLAFAFIPLVLLFIYKLYKKQNSSLIIAGGISFSLLILSHNAISLIFVPIIFIYCRFLIYLSEKRSVLIYSFAGLLAIGFLLSAFFWVPALFEGKYTLRNILTAGSYVGRFVHLSQLVYGPWNYGQTGQFTLQLGVFQWIALLFSPITLFIFKKDKNKLYLAILCLTSVFAAIFLMLSMSGFIWAKLMILQNFQFPWRFLAITVFSTAVLGAFFVETLSKLFGAKISNVLIAVAILVILVISSIYAKPKAYQYKPESFYSGIYHSTTDTGESSPIWSVRFMEQTPKAPAEIISGKGSVEEVSRTSVERVFEYKSESDTKVLVNILYFPNWTIYVDGEKQAVEFQDTNHRGLMTFNVKAGNHKIEAIFQDTKLRAISNAISVVIFFNILGFLGFRFVKRHLS